MQIHKNVAENKIVLVANVQIADWRTEKRHYELTAEDADVLIERLRPEDNKLEISGRELFDLLRNEGEISTRVALGGHGGAVRRTLEALSRVAWEYDVKVTLDELLNYAPGDEYFADYCAAYTITNGEIDVERI